MNRCFSVATAAILFSVASAGCLSDSGTQKDVSVEVTVSADADISPAYEKIRGLLQGVPCTVNGVSTTMTTGNLKVLAQDQLDDVGPVRTHGEFDLHGNLAVEAFYNQRGFSLIDVSDPAEPRQVGFYTFSPAPVGTPVESYPSASTYDVKFSADGRFVFVGLSDRIQVINVTNPAQPKFETRLLHPANYRGQAHMIYDSVIGGVEYLFVVPSISGTGLLVAKFDASQSVARLEVAAVHTSTAPSAVAPQALAPHDAYVTFDAVLNHTLLYLANGFNGVIVMNVDDPVKPETLLSLPAAVGSAPTSSAPSYYHSIQVEWIDGKRIVATSAEVGYNTVKIFDLTDFKAPKFLGQWVYDERQPTYLEHNLQIVNGTLFVAHYQQGLFGFDLNAYVKAPQPRLAVALHFQPPSAGLVWDVVLKDGLLYLSDISQGLHVLGFGCFLAGDPALSSDG